MDRYRYVGSISRNPHPGLNPGQVWSLGGKNKSCTSAACGFMTPRAAKSIFVCPRSYADLISEILHYTCAVDVHVAVDRGSEIRGTRV